MKKLVIQSLEVSGSPFFKNFKLDFSESLNCIMGGRGTGKTTIVEFIKACVRKNIESDSYSYSLLKENLGDGSITLRLKDSEGINYKVEKLLGEKPQIYSNGVIKDIDEAIGFLALDIYETNRIERIGKEPKDRLKLIDSRNYRNINAKKNKIYNYQLSLDNNANRIKEVKHKINLKREQLRDFGNIEEQINKHEKNKPKSLEEQEKEEFESADKNQKTRNRESRILKNFEKFTNQILNDAESLKESIELHKVDETDNLVNKDLFETLRKQLEKTIEEISLSVKDISNEVNRFENSVNKVKEIIKSRHNEQEAKFVSLKKKFEKHSSYLNTYNQLTTRLEQKKLNLAELEELEHKLKLLSDSRNKISSDYSELKEEIFNLRLNIVKELNNRFKDEIVIQLSFGGIKDDFEHLLREGLRGSGIHYNILVPEIATALSPRDFAKCIHENNQEILKQIRNIDESRSNTIYESFKGTDVLYEIEKLYLPDRPDFLLKVNRDGRNKPDQYKNSEQLSMGQRCTTVLPIIFAVSENPLIIDQPEDNLDNEYISETIREIIKSQKEIRQLLFVTHNPNIPVLSDSEYNIFFKYKNQSYVSSSGDVDEVKQSIIELLEGGREAFERRKEIYGVI